MVGMNIFGIKTLNADIRIHERNDDSKFAVLELISNGEDGQITRATYFFDSPDELMAVIEKIHAQLSQQLGLI